MLTAYSRVTVVTADRKVDLALPSALPVADVVPQVLRYCAPEGRDGQPTSWILARLGGQPLGLGQTLSDAGVLDGDVLELRSQNSDVRPAMVEDVRDAVEDSADAAGGAWTPRTSVTVAVLGGAIALLVLAGAVYVDLAAPSGLRLDLHASAGSELVSVVAATAALVGLAAWAARFAAGWVAQVCVVAAMIWAYLIGLALGDRGGWDVWTTTLVAMAFVAVVAGISRLITPAAMAHLAAAIVLLVAAVTHSVVGMSSIPIAQTYRILPVAGLLAAGVIPRLSLSVGGLASADYRVRHVGQLGLTTLRARYRQSNAILVGGLVGTSLVLLWGSLHLSFSDRAWDRYLALSIAVVALLRSRVFSRTQHMIPFRVTGVVVLALQVVRLGVDEPDLRPWVVLITLGIIASVVGVSTLAMSGITRARVKRTLNIVEFLMVVDLVVVLCGATGVYADLGRLV